MPGNLPAQATSFLGREGDLVEVRKLLRESRLVTLTGVGGVGKTRLAVQAAADAAAGYKDGVWLVELAGVTDTAAIGHAVASVLGIAQGRARPSRTASSAHSPAGKFSSCSTIANT